MKKLLFLKTSYLSPAVILLLSAVLTACSGQQPSQSVEASSETTVAATSAPVESTVAVSTAASTEAATSAPQTQNVQEESGKGKGRYSYITVPEYTFTEENWPYMDGSTASVPMGKAITECLLGVDEEKAANLCQFNRTTQSFRNLMNGAKDILVVGEPNASVFAEMKAEGFGYELEEIATDALVFVVNESNPVDNLTTQQIRDIYSGVITNWKEVGGADAEIIAFQRNEGAGSQALIKKLVMGDTLMTDAPSEYIIGEIGELMTAVKNYDNSANALGYSVYYYANDMKMAKGLKILKVDGVEPSDKTIRSRKYPHLNAYYCVIPAKPQTPDEASAKRSEAARVIYEWLGTQDGQELIASLGYVSIKAPKLTENRKEELTELITTYNGKKPGELGKLKAGTSYGTLIPYVGDRLMESDEDGYSYQAGYMYGFLNDAGQMVTDPVYTDITQLGYYDSNKLSGQSVYIPMYAAAVRVSANQDEDTEEHWGSSRYYLISLDGSYVSETEYSFLSPDSSGVVCMENWDSDSMEYRGFDGKVIVSDKELRACVAKAFGEVRVKLIDWSSFRREGRYYCLLVGDAYCLIDDTSLEVKGGGYVSVDCQWNGMYRVTVDVETDQETLTRSMLLDKDLQVVIPSDYTNISVLNNENFIAADSNETRIDLYDKEGKLIRQIHGISYASRSAYGFLATLETANSNIEAAYNCDGDLLLMAPSNGVAFSLTELSLMALKGKKEDGKAFVYQESGKGILYYHLDTGETRMLEEYNYTYPLYTGEGSAELPYLIATYSEEIGNEYHQHFMLIDENLKTVYEGDGYIQALYDSTKNKWYMIHYHEDDSATIMDDQLKVVSDNVRGDISIYDGMLLTVQDQTTEARRPGSEVCFRYIHNTAGED